MGKTKIKTIGDTVEEKKPAKKPGRQVFDSEGEAHRTQTRRDELVERLKAELAGEGKQTVDDRKVEDSTLKVEGRTLKDKDLSSTINSQKTTIHRPSSIVKIKPRSKKYQGVVKDLDKSKTYPLTEAVELTKKLSYSKFTGTLEAHINTLHTNIRGLVSLPFASGKKLNILAFGKGAETSGADVAGSDATIEEINKGKVNFDLVITTAEWMPKLAKVAKILGPRGLMPNPKNGTITSDLKKAVESFQSGKTEYKTESKTPVIHLPLGKLNQPTEELSANIKMLIQTLGKTRIKKVTLSPTMGPSVKLDLTSL